MKLTIGILAIGMAAATAWGQNPDEIQNARDTMRAVQMKKQIDSNNALQGSSPAPAPSSAPSSSSSPSQSSPSRHAASASSSRSAKAKVVVVRTPKPRKQSVAVEASKPAVEKPAPKKTYSLTDRRDPFVSPVVNRSMTGSGCSSGKRCLAIDQIALKGIVRSDNGMIAVVVNSLDKAYFLRENDPVFNGYVVKITGDSIIFKETVQDRLGKPFTREVTKRITTPAV